MGESCIICGDVRSIRARRMCSPCYQRWYRAEKDGREPEPANIPVEYTGEIRCGDTYEGIAGFVWGHGKKDGTVNFYIVGQSPAWDAPAALNQVPVKRIRGSLPNVLNPCGTLLYEKCAKP